MSVREDGRRTLTIVKDGHRYAFRYRLGDEIPLFYALMECATDDRFNITSKDLVDYIDCIMNGLKSDTVFELPPSAPPSAEAA